MELQEVRMPSLDELRELKDRLTENLVQAARMRLEREGGKRGTFEWKDGWRANIALPSDWPEMILVITVAQAREESWKILKESNVEVVLRIDPFEATSLKLYLIQK